MKNVDFSIINTGSVNLTLPDNPRVAIDSTDPNAFIVLLQPTSPILPSEFGIFTIRFYADFDGSYSATVTIANNDPDEGTFNFTLTGIGDPMY
jgi:hypothetical protein